MVRVKKYQKLWLDSKSIRNQFQACLESKSIKNQFQAWLESKSIKNFA